MKWQRCKKVWWWLLGVKPPKMKTSYSRENVRYLWAYVIKAKGKMEAT